MKHAIIHSIVIVSLLGLSGCGYNSQDRVLSGAGLGAATGAVTTAVVGGSVGTGILLGTAAGAIVGGVTQNEDINLGKPFWRR